MRAQRLHLEDSTDRVRALVLSDLDGIDQVGAADYLVARTQAPPRMSRETARYGLFPGLTYPRNSGYRYGLPGMRFPPTRGALGQVLTGRTR